MARRARAGAGQKEVVRNVCVTALRTGRTPRRRRELACWMMFCEPLGGVLGQASKLPDASFAESGACCGCISGSKEPWDTLSWL